MSGYVPVNLNPRFKREEEERELGYVPVDQNKNLLLGTQKPKKIVPAVQVSEPKRKFLDAVPNKVRVRDVVRETPQATVKVVGAVVDFGKAVGQSIMSSFWAAGAALHDGDIEAKFTPTGRVQQALTGRTEPFNFRDIGEETLRDFGVGEKNVQKFGLGTGVFIGALDIIPGLPKLKPGLVNTIAKTSNVDTIFKALRPVLKGTDDEVMVLARTMQNINDPRMVSTIMDSSIPGSQIKLTGLMETSNRSPLIERKAIEAVPELGTTEGLTALRLKTRGVVPDEAVQAAAKTRGWSEQRVLNIKEGTILNAEDKMAVSGVVNNAIDRLRALEAQAPAARLNLDDPDSVMLLQNLGMEKVNVMKLLSVERGIAAETGRALRASRFTTTAERITFEEQRIAKYLADPKIRPEAKEYIIKRLNEFKGTPDEFADLLMKLRDSSLKEKFVEYATAIRLSTPTTHVVNVATSISRMVMEVPRMTIAGFMDSTVGRIYGGNRQRFVSDWRATAMGLHQGVKELGPHLGRALVDEQYALKVKKTQDVMLSPAIKGRLGMDTATDRFQDWLGPKVRVTFRALGLEDVAIRIPAERAFVYTSAHRHALGQGLKQGTDAYNKEVARFLNDAPTSPHLMQKASEYADIMLFQEELHNYAKAVNNLRNSVPETKLILPFYRTPVNLIRQAIEFSPAAPILPSVRKALGTGPATRIAVQRVLKGVPDEQLIKEFQSVRGEAADALSKMVMGTMAISSVAAYAMGGNITLGAPRNPAERDAFFASGKQPYSLRFGNKWYPYNRFSPFTELFIAGGVIAEAIKSDDNKKIEDIITDSFFGISTGVLDRSFMVGLNDALNAMANPDGARAQNFVRNLIVGTTYPTVIGAMARSLDPTIREVNSIKDTYLARTPFLTHKLPARTDVFGEDLVRPGTAVTRFISPVIPSRVQQDVVRDELAAIDYNLGFPTKSAFGEEMDDDTYRVFKNVTGKLTYVALYELVTGPQFQYMTPRQKEQVVENVVRRIREEVRPVVATEQLIIREIREKLKAGGMTDKAAREASDRIYARMKGIDPLE